MKTIPESFVSRNFFTGLVNVWRTCRRLVGFEPRRRRQLHLCESLALGEHRSLSVVEFGSKKLLLGSTGGALTMLATFEEAKPEADVLTWRFVNGDLVRCA